MRVPLWLLKPTTAIATTTIAAATTSALLSSTTILSTTPDATAATTIIMAAILLVGLTGKVVSSGSGLLPVRGSSELHVVVPGAGSNCAVVDVVVGAYTYRPVKL